uniref:Actin related protein 2/3 complex subunit 5 like n=1 Tax=Myotis myotis TaxID=51298 RepID=A0A7J7UMQ2_MYOMY|nr:hypothetical protein mMyoMyo1_001027 [Myotis myotis]
MARNTLSSRFRRVDIDEFDENKFVDEQEEAAAAAGEPGPDPNELHAPVADLVSAAYECLGFLDLDGLSHVQQARLAYSFGEMVA